MAMELDGPHVRGTGGALGCWWTVHVFVPLMLPLFLRALARDRWAWAW